MYLQCHCTFDEHTSHLLKEFISKYGLDPKSFLGVSIDDLPLPLVKGIVERNVLIYNFGTQEGEYVGELVKQSIEKFEKTRKY